jgi:hypothetical protein
MRDRYQAEIMFGGQHATHNPRGCYWAVGDMEKMDCDTGPDVFVVIDYIDEATAKDLATRLSMAEQAAQTLRHAERSKRTKARMAAKAKLDADMAARVEALGDQW